jgi:hypothetical protein
LLFSISSFSNCSSLEKIAIVRKERNNIKIFQEKKGRSMSPTNRPDSPHNFTAEELRLQDERKAAALIEMVT